MQKKLIALAVAGVMAAPMAAQAGSAEIYGKVRLSVGVVGNDDTSANRDDSKLNLTSHNSRFGVKGSEALDGDLTAIYQFETEVDFDDNDNGLFDSMRDTYLGLKGGFGTVKFGRMNSPYKNAAGDVDVWKDTHGDFNAIIGTMHDDRFDNTIAYYSPAMNGITLGVAYITDTNDDDLPDSSAAENDGISIAAMYESGPLYASLAYQSLAEAGSGSEDAEGTKLTLGYTVGMTKLGFAYEMDDMGGNNNDQDRMYFSVAQDMGDGMAVKAALGMADDRGNTADSGATFFALGGTKSIGDSAEFYALYAQVDNDSGATTGGTGDFGLYEFAATGTPEASANVFALGVNLKFSSM